MLIWTFSLKIKQNKTKKRGGWAQLKNDGTTDKV